MAQREAFVKGAEYAHNTQWCTNAASPEVMAIRTYEMPKVKRPRVVADPEQKHRQWRVANGSEGPRLEVSSGSGWYGAHEWLPIPERVRVWADLLANPTEVVDAE